MSTGLGVQQPAFIIFFIEVKLMYIIFISGAQHNDSICTYYQPITTVSLVNSNLHFHINSASFQLNVLEK